MVFFIILLNWCNKYKFLVFKLFGHKIKKLKYFFMNSIIHLIIKTITFYKMPVVTRSRSAECSWVAGVAVPSPTPKAVAPKKVVKKSKATDYDQELAQREKALVEREKALVEREKALVEREKALVEREKELIERGNALVESGKAFVKTLENTSKPSKNTPKKSKKISVIYTAKYRDEDPEFEKIGEFADEKSSIIGVITWLIKNSKGGFDAWGLNQLMEDRGEEGYECEMDEKETIQYMSKKCKTWNDLLNVCRDYGDSYFEDEDGWFLKKI